MDSLVFTKAIMRWHSVANVRELPWKGDRNPYRIWLSEIMLQQTRAGQGIPYYLKFVETYPRIEDLAAAPDDEVFKLWQGLGYYARCRNMLVTARQIVREHGSMFPKTHEDILSLKGIGPYTAAAIASFAYGLPHAVVDGNVYRVLARYFGISDASDTSGGKKLFQKLADSLLDREDPGGFNQAIMDLGATICTPALPKCEDCPLAARCIALRDGLVELLPVKSKKAKVRTRYFHYLMLHSGDEVWLRLRDGKDIWKGLYEPFLIETETLTTYQSLRKHSVFPALAAGATQKDEGEFSQKLSHQIIRSRFFSVHTDIRPEISGGIWISKSAIREYPVPKLLVDFFEKKGYF